ncbi:DUF6053 domain-containing protein [Lysobacter enzymogenes]|uniref:DUF6053 domain-containing protein n=1 Tax=Lysobacter enzymogenes TaxID=69 RepID=UPI003747DEE1
MAATSVPTLSSQVVVIWPKGVGTEVPPTNAGLAAAATRPRPNRASRVFAGPPADSFVGHAGLD